jgi:hypothetical protein
MEDETDGNFEQLTLANEEQGAHDEQQRGRKRAAPPTCLKPSEEACPHRSGSRKRSASDSDGEAFRDQLSVTGGERQSCHAHDTGMPRTSRGDLRERNDACTAFLFSFKPRNQRGQRTWKRVCALWQAFNFASFFGGRGRDGGVHGPGGHLWEVV